MEKKTYIQPQISVLTIETSYILAGSPEDKGDGHEHGHITIGGKDDSEWFSARPDGMPVVDDDDDTEW